MSAGAFSHTVVYPLTVLGIEPSRWSGVHLETMIATWLGMVLLGVFVVLFRKYCFEYDSSVYVGVERALVAFGDLCVESIGYFRYDYFSFAMTMALFAIATSVVCLFPFVEEATRDVNTTFALAFASYFYVSYKKIVHDGLGGYLEEFLGPKELPSMAIRIAMIPLEIMGSFSRVLSMAFRLFGNIMGGAAVFAVVKGIPYFDDIMTVFFCFALLSIAFRFFGGESRYPHVAKMLNDAEMGIFLVTFLQIFFGVFETLIQGFVLGMLTLTYLGLTIEHEHDAEAKGVIW